MTRLHMEALSFERMHSGQKSLLVTERVSADDFASFADNLAQVLGGTLTDSADSPDARLRVLEVDGCTYYLAHDQCGVSIEPTGAGPWSLQDVRDRLKRYRAKQRWGMGFAVVGLVMFTELVSFILGRLIPP